MILCKYSRQRDGFEGDRGTRKQHMVVVLEAQTSTKQILFVDYLNYLWQLTYLLDTLAQCLGPARH